MLALVLAAENESTEAVRPLAGRSLAVILAIILVIAAAVILAGLGYFSPGDDDKH